MTDVEKLYALERKLAAYGNVHACVAASYKLRSESANVLAELCKRNLYRFFIPGIDTVGVRGIFSEAFASHFDKLTHIYVLYGF